MHRFFITSCIFYFLFYFFGGVWFLWGKKKKGVIEKFIELVTEQCTSLSIYELEFHFLSYRCELEFLACSARARLSYRAKTSWAQAFKSANESSSNIISEAQLELKPNLSFPHFDLAEHEHLKARLGWAGLSLFVTLTITATNSDSVHTMGTTKTNLI